MPSDINSKNEATTGSETIFNPKIPRIRVDDAIKIYKRGKIEVVALRGLSAEFYPGEIALIMGPSGSGKTTLLNSIGALDHLNSGKIIIDNQFDITQFTDNDLEKFRRDRIGFVFQTLNLIPELTAAENVLLPLELSGNLNKEKKEFVHKLLNLVGLEARKKHRPDELSGGEQQRIGVATALANNPDIILCDEPTGELDSHSKKVIMDLLRSIITQFPNKTMIIVSHDPELKVIADRMYYIRDGDISHKFDKDEMDALRAEQVSLEGQNGLNADLTYKPSNPQEAQNAVLMELREISHFVKEKIDNIEKKMHPI
ncbi:MAG: ABC transporter ATP-binding protein [Promethearchaeota archaeon]